MFESLSTYWRLLRGSHRSTALVVLLIAAAGFFEGAALYALAPMLDASFLTKHGTPAGNPARAIAPFLGLGLLSALTRMWADYRVLALRVRIEEDLKIRMSSVLFGMRWTEFLSLRQGDLSKATLLEAFNVALGAQSAVQAVGNALICVAFVGFAFVLSWQMTVLTLLFGVLAALSYKVAGRRSFVHTRELSRVAGNIGGYVADIFGNLKFFKSTSASVRAQRDLYREYARYSHAYFHSQVYGIFLRLGFEGGSILFVAALLGVSVMMRGQSFAAALVFLVVFYRLAPRIMAVQENLYQAHNYSSWYHGWRERHDFAMAHGEISTGTRAPLYADALEFQRVSFSFPGSDRQVLRDVSWRLERGKCLALVGESGSGKSTSLDLITGLLRPQVGEVRLDGVPLTEVALDDWRARLGIVMQESPIFHTTVLENIAWGDDAPDVAWAEHCARRAHAADFIAQLPLGIHTEIGEKGGRLSGGQRQRIALARALYRRPSLLILDEATSALDSDSESRIQDALEELRGELSILIVAHRLKTVRMADEIIVLNEGTVVERGSWNGLMSIPNGIFRAMVQLQTGGESLRHDAADVAMPVRT